MHASTRKSNAKPPARKSTIDSSIKPTHPTYEIGDRVIVKSEGQSDSATISKIIADGTNSFLYHVYYDDDEFECDVEPDSIKLLLKEPAATTPFPLPEPISNSEPFLGIKGIHASNLRFSSKAGDPNAWNNRKHLERWAKYILDVGGSKGPELCKLMMDTWKCEVVFRTTGTECDDYLFDDHTPPHMFRSKLEVARHMKFMVDEEAGLPYTTAKKSKVGAEAVEAAPKAKKRKAPASGAGSGSGSGPADKSKPKPPPKPPAYIDICDICKASTLTDATRAILCDGCNFEFHFDCLIPKMTELPLFNWFCEACRSKMYIPSRLELFGKRRQDAFGCKKCSWKPAGCTGCKLANVHNEGTPVPGGKIYAKAGVQIQQDIRTHISIANDGRQSDHNGCGLIAKQFIPKGKTFVDFTASYSDRPREFARAHFNSRDYIGCKDGYFILREPVLRLQAQSFFFNEANYENKNPEQEANIMLESRNTPDAAEEPLLNWVALRDIQVGEELLINGSIDSDPGAV